MSDRRITWVVLLAAMGLAGTSAVAAEQAPAPPSAAANEAATVVYRDQRMSIADLFKEYGKIHKDLDEVAEKEKVARGRLEELQRQQAQGRKDLATEQAPVRADLGKARAEEKEARRALSERAPARPRLLPLPPRPAVRSSSSNSGTDSSQDAYYRWQVECQRVNQQNQQAEKRYQQDMAEYKAKQAKAQAALDKVLDKIKALLAKLDQMEKDADAKQPEVVAALKTVNGEILSCGREETVVNTRLEEAIKALRTVPESVRLKAGIIEWEGALHELDDLEALHTQLQGEIDRVRAQLKAEAEKTGLPFADDWRHPQQDRMDGLKALIDKAKAARAGA
jgi:DNA repair exonuclease SbcCD ATPase subunit